MKKIISLTLVLSFIFSMFAISGINSAADSKYDKLYKESREYRNTIGGGAFYYPLFSPELTVLLYTKAAEEMTLKKGYTHGGDIFGVDASLLTFNIMDGPEYLECPELYEAVEPCVTLPYGMRESRSYLRECIKYFGITKSELLKGFRLMKEDPDYIRPILSFLTDEEYESAKLSDGTFGRTDYPDFVIEAMFIKDDAKAHDLITYNNAVYIPELGRVTEYHE